MNSHVTDIFRAWPWLFFSLAFILVVALVAPYQLGVLAWSLSKLSLGAYLGYWIDRSVFHYCRPHALITNTLTTSQVHALAAAMIRRAIIMAAVILALGLGV